jgi:hypothetical protein
MTDREATPDELAGMAWWNGLSEAERGEWLRRAGSEVLADAWAAFRRRGQNEARLCPANERDLGPDNAIL